MPSIRTHGDFSSTFLTESRPDWVDMCQNAYPYWAICRYWAREADDEKCGPTWPLRRFSFLSLIDLRLSPTGTMYYWELKLLIRDWCFWMHLRLFTHIFYKKISTSIIHTYISPYVLIHYYVTDYRCKDRKNVSESRGKIDSIKWI